MATSAFGAAPDGVPQEVVTPVVLESTQIFNIYSKANQQDYRIQVRLPGSYQSNPAKKYPVIIKVDGQWDFPLASSVYNCIYFDGQMPEAIIIGIDWANVTGNVHVIRARDLLPAPIQRFENSGHAKKFISVLADEIIPALNQRLRLNGQEFLLGGSWGATFTTFALLERPDVFEGAIAIAGDYTSAGNVFDQQLKSLANSKALDGKHLYIGVGKGDSVAPDVIAYAEKLKAANLKGFKLKLDSLEGFGHSGMNVPGYASGYKYIFERPQITVSPKDLKQFVGKYTSSVEGWSELVVQIESGKLTAMLGDGKTPLLAKAENDFYHPDRFFNLSFAGTTAKVETFFGDATFKKVEAASQ
ncbi:MAG TPA: alpha/beta hydrolase-fold protein [Cellvibrio sp.]|nr:alpha/beta hydrolase-fold protein [Cellvibrio sp.]